MKRLLLVAGVLVGAGVVAFLFAPTMPWTSPAIVDAHYRAQVSPSYYFFRCGVVSNLAIVYIETNQVFPAPSFIINYYHGAFGALWACGQNVTANQGAFFGWW